MSVTPYVRPTIRLQPCTQGAEFIIQRPNSEVGAFYWTVLTPDIVNLGREEQGSVSV